MSDLKRLALVVLARTFNDNDVRRLKVRADPVPSPDAIMSHLASIHPLSPQFFLLCPRWCAAKLRYAVML